MLRWIGSLWALAQRTTAAVVLSSPAAGAHRERERQAHQLQELARASIEISPLASEDEVLRLTTERARAIIGSHQAVTSLTRDETFAQIVHTTSLSDKYAAYRSYDGVPDGSGIYTLVTRVNRPFRLTQAELVSHQAWRGFGAEASRHPPLRGWLAVPLIGRDGRNLGLIQLSDKCEGEFTAADEAMLVQLAQVTSIAIENVRLYGQMQRARARLEKLSHRLVAAQEEERRRIARELHDEIGQSLTAIKLNLQTVQHLGHADPRAVSESIAIASRTLQQVRNLSLDLRPSLLDDLGLPAALRWYLDRQSQRLGWEGRIATEALEPRLPPAVETVCFRVAQEALTNAARHAQATRVWIDLAQAGGELHLSIRDDGVGFDVSTARERAQGGASLGLLGMEERVALAGGRLDVASLPGKGTEISVYLPLSPASAAAS